MDKEITVNETLYRIVPLPGKISFRSYRDEDYETVCDFLIELNQRAERISTGTGRALNG